MAGIVNKYLDIRDRYGDDLTDGTVLGAVPGLELPSADKAVLRELGKSLAEIAASDENERNAALWRDLNDRKMTRPAVYINEICWHEMNVDDELTLTTTHPMATELETYLRQQLYLWRHMRANMVVTPYIECPMVVYDSGFGIEEQVETRATDDLNNIVSRHFNVLLESMDDVARIKDPEVVYDRERTLQNKAVLDELFDGVMDVKVTGSKGLWFTPWDYLIRVMGIEETMINMYDEPEFVDAVASRYVDAAMKRMEQYNRLGIWSSNNLNARVGSGGYGYTGDLPPALDNLAGADPKALWGCGNAQIFSEVSPDMHYEFSLRHELRWIECFGLAYYGCCEPLHHKLHILQKIPNLRKISMSPWSDLTVAAEFCRDRYVLSCKPSPAVFAGDSWKPEQARADINDIIRKSGGCSYEIIMKDISTVRYHPERLWDWTRIVMECIDEAY